jgi:hypothetical protein
MGQEIGIPWGWQRPSNTHQWIVAWHTDCDGHPHKVCEGNASGYCSFCLHERVDFIKEGPRFHTINMSMD